MSFPYFKNYVNDYLAGSIMSCDAETQGIFTMICMLYWKKDCQLIYEPEKLARRFHIEKERFEIAIELLKDDVLTITDDQRVVIKFLDNQYVEMSELSKLNSEKGRLSAQKRTAVQQRLNNGLTAVNHTDTDTDTDTEYIKEKNKRKVFVKPTVKEITDYCIERKNAVNAENFFNFYESKGWKVGSSPMKCWQAAVRTWEKNINNQGNAGNGNRINPKHIGNNQQYEGSRDLPE